jgi:hypothetical protein
MSASRVFVFETEHVQAMDEAFDAVCGRLELSPPAQETTRRSLSRGGH